MIINVDNKKQFEELVKGELVLVDFWAPWCGPCRMLAPNIEEVQEKNPKLTVVKVNCDNNEELAKEFMISAIPTVLLFKNGQFVKQNVGFMNVEQLEEFLKN